MVFVSLGYGQLRFVLGGFGRVVLHFEFVDRAVPRAVVLGFAVGLVRVGCEVCVHAVVAWFGLICYWFGDEHECQSDRLGYGLFGWCGHCVVPFLVCAGLGRVDLRCFCAGGLDERVVLFGCVAVGVALVFVLGDW